MKIVWITVFGIAMAFAESAVVVYLRAIYYPEGFAFPLKAFTDYKILVEVLREVATIFMLLSVACLTAKKAWERFAYFIVAFGIWDIFYYVWLKVLIDWPSSIFTWDILFLIPLPWIGPVIAPLSIACIMIVFGLIIISSYQRGNDFRVPVSAQVLASVGIAVVLYSFMYDTGATLHQKMPLPYRYDLLAVTDLLFVAGIVIAYKNNRKHKKGSRL